MAPAFSVSPFQTSAAVLDYTTDSARAHYKAATAPLGKGEKRNAGYDLTPGDAFALLVTLGTRATKMGWSAPGGLLWVRDANGEEHSMVDEFGVLTTKEIVQSETTTLSQKSRKAQDLHMLYHCLLNSMSAVSTTTIGLNKEDCYI